MQNALDAPPPKKLMRSKGIHFLTRDVTRGTALTVPIGDEHLFVLPWQGKSLFATTDTFYDGDPDKVAPDFTDIEQLLSKANQALPGLELTVKDIDYAYAGLRPLVADPATPDKGTYGLSRGSEIVDHENQGGPAGLFSALGGKWTTSRRLAEEIVDLVSARLGFGDSTCRTSDTLLACAPRQDLADFMDQMRANYPQVKTETLDGLARLYGRLLPELMAQKPVGLSKLKDPLLAACVSFAVHHEMAQTLEDVILRRLVHGQTGEISAAKIAHNRRLYGQTTCLVGRRKTTPMRPNFCLFDNSYQTLANAALVTFPIRLAQFAAQNFTRWIARQCVNKIDRLGQFIASDTLARPINNILCLHISPRL